MSRLPFGVQATPHKLVRQCLSVLVWCSISKRAVRTLRIVFDPPGFQDDSGLKKGTEEFPVQALVTQLVVEAFNVAVLPWEPGVM